MVEIIGVAVIVMLSWVLAWTMAAESDAEKRRLSSQSRTSPLSGESGGKRAA